MVFFNRLLIFVEENDNLAAFRDVFVAGKMGPRDGGAVNDYAVVFVERVFHAPADDAIGAVDVGVQKQGAEDNGADETAEAE